MALVAWIAVAVIVLVAIGLGVGVFFSGLIRGAEIIGENPTVQNASQEAQDFVTDRTDVAGEDFLVVTTSEARYDQGEPVIFTVKNIHDRTLTFPDSSLGLEIENVNNAQEYRVPSAQVVTELESGESKTITWDQDAPAGDYTATVKTTSDQSISAQVSFKITG
jgi:hypothetical protein